MKISALRLFNVKRFAGRGVAIEGIGDGVNVLCAANEYGKSTSFEALHALFFQPHSSTSGDVRNLRPYSGGNPLIEADISAAEGSFRITKQFYGGRSARVTDLSTGRLVAQADEAENFIAGLIKGGTAGPAGLLWVRQGVTGIEKRSRADEDSEKQVRMSLLESVQGEVEAITGGRRMAGIMAATAEALADLVTATGRAKAGGRYAAAIEERDRLAAQKQKLADDVAALRGALDKRAQAVKRLDELDQPEEKQERQQAIEKAQATFDAAKAQGELLKTAEAQLNLARARRDTADQSLKTFRAALEKAATLRVQRQAAEQRRAEAADRRRDATDAITKARADVEREEAAEQEARDLLARLDAALRAQEASERLAELRKRLADAESTRHAIEETQAKLALVKLPPNAIEDLQYIDIEIAKLRAIEETARASVAITYVNDAAPRVTMDGAPLTDGDERSYDAQAQLIVPGIVAITLRASRPPRSDNRLEQAEAKRRTLLASIGVDNLSAARERQLRAQDMTAELRGLQNRLSTLAPAGLAKLREEVAAHDLTGAETIELEQDPAQARIALAEAEKRRMQARLARHEAEPLQTAADNAFIAAETALAELTIEQAQLDTILGPEAARSDREHGLSQTLNDVDRALVDATTQADRLRAGAIDLASAEAALARARSVARAADDEANTLRETSAGLNAEIRTKSDEAVEETWRETAEALAAAEARADAFENEVAVLQRLTAALESARSDARDLYLKPVMAELRPLLNLLFDDVAITFDDKTLLPQKISRNGLEEDVDRLSGGMREQLSVLTRLAFARLLARDGRPAPVILDDALVYSDDDRIEKMFDALHRQSRDQQIIVFSCRQRAFQKLGGNVLQMTDWRLPERA